MIFDHTADSFKTTYKPVLFNAKRICERKIELQRIGYLCNSEEVLEHQIANCICLIDNGIRLLYAKFYCSRL